eukprot:IDg14285t1
MYTQAGSLNFQKQPALYEIEELYISLSVDASCILSRSVSVKDSPVQAIDCLSHTRQVENSLISNFECLLQYAPRALSKPATTIFEYVRVVWDHFKASRGDAGGIPARTLLCAMQNTGSVALEYRRRYCLRAAQCRSSISE